MRRIKIFLEKYKFWILIFAGGGILFDIFIFNPTWDLVILWQTSLWVLTIWLYKLEGRVSIAGALIFLAVCPFLLILNKESIAEKLAIWAYVFLAVGGLVISTKFLLKVRQPKNFG